MYLAVHVYSQLQKQWTLKNEILLYYKTRENFRFFFLAWIWTLQFQGKIKCILYLKEKLPCVLFFLRMLYFPNIQQVNKKSLCWFLRYLIAAYISNFLVCKRKKRRIISIWIRILLNSLLGSIKTQWHSLELHTMHRTKTRVWPLSSSTLRTWHKKNQSCIKRRKSLVITIIKKAFSCLPPRLVLITLNLSSGRGSI